MRKANIASGGASFAIAAFLAGFAIASCGGKIAADDSVTGSDDDASASDSRDGSSGSSAVDATTSFDAGSIIGVADGAPPYPPVDNGPQDTTPACESRSALDCACAGEDCPKPPDSYLAQIVDDCLASGGYVCNWVYVDYDSEGCAIDLRALDPNDAFVECATKELDSQRWKCMTGGGTLSTYVDCTTK